VDLYRGTGCSRCLRSGYYERVGIYEYVPFDPGLADLVMTKASTESMYRYAIDHGAITLRADAISKVLHGQTSSKKPSASRRRKGSAGILPAREVGGAAVIRSRARRRLLATWKAPIQPAGCRRHEEPCA